MPIARPARLSVLLPLAFALALPAVGAAAPAEKTPPAKPELRYVYLTQGNPAGSGSTTWGEKGEQVFQFEFNDRGRGPKTEERVWVDAKGIPVEVRITGHDYWKVAVDERFDWAQGKAAWKSASEAGGRELKDPAVYVSLNGAPQEFGVVAAAILKAGGSLPLLPAGSATVSKPASLTLKAGGESRKVDLVAVEGFYFSPVLLWLDADGNLFASIQGWSTYIRAGWEGVAPELEKAERAFNEGRATDLAHRLARHPKGGLAVTHARLFDPATRKLLAGTTVVVAGNKIQAVGKDGEVAIPAGFETIDAQGKVLLPGMWDMHAHVSEQDGPLNLASGVTTVRDLANDTDKLLALRQRWDSGEGIGTRILMAGFIDGPGPYAGPTKVLVDTEAKALAAVENYAKLGYVQVKMYSSLDPKLVPVIVKRAHELGLRVSGHIPHGLFASEAVEEGFDEIQHVNFLFLNFLPKTIDTRTPARFSEVAENAAGFDLKSEKAEAFFQLLQEHKTVSDPTLVAFEDMIAGRAGEMSQTFASVADRLPAQVQRGLYAGGLNPPAEKVQRYRDSYRQCLAMVKALYDHGIRIVPGTDNLAGFAYHRELELYAEAGIPNADILRIATLGAAEVMHRDGDLGSVVPGKLADFFLVDGDPTTKISDVRRVVLTVKDGTIYEPAKLYAALGIKPGV